MARVKILASALSNDCYCTKILIYFDVNFYNSWTQFFECFTDFTKYALQYFSCIIIINALRGKGSIVLFAYILHDSLRCYKKDEMKLLLLNLHNANFLLCVAWTHSNNITKQRNMHVLVTVKNGIYPICSLLVFCRNMLSNITWSKYLNFIFNLAKIERKNYCSIELLAHLYKSHNLVKIWVSFNLSNVGGDPAYVIHWFPKSEFGAIFIFVYSILLKKVIIKRKHRKITKYFFKTLLILLCTYKVIHLHLFYFLTYVLEMLDKCLKLTYHISVFQVSLLFYGLYSSITIIFSAFSLLLLKILHYDPIQSSE